MPAHLQTDFQDLQHLIWGPALDDRAFQRAKYKGQDETWFGRRKQCSNSDQGVLDLVRHASEVSQVANELVAQKILGNPAEAAADAACRQHI